MLLSVRWCCLDSRNMAAYPIISETWQYDADIAGNIIVPGTGARMNISQLSLPIQEPSTYYRTDGAGYFALVQIRNKQWCQWSYPFSDMPYIVKHIDRRYNTYITQNNFRKRNRRIENLLGINSNYVDCDTYNMPIYWNVTPQKQADDLLYHCENIGIPAPSIIVFSGRGLQAKWLYHAPLPPAALHRWNWTQRYLVDKLQEFGADPGARDASRVLRLEQTVNTKPDPPEVVRIIYPEHLADICRYNFDEIADAVLPFTREQIQEFKHNRLAARKRKKPGPGSRQAIQCYKNLAEYIDTEINWKRVPDFRTLADIRTAGSGIYPDGERNNFLFLYGVVLARALPEHKIFPEVVEFVRNHFPEHWTINKTRQKISAVLKRAGTDAQGITTDARYKLRTSTIISRLNITTDEQRHAGMKVLLSPEIRKEKDRQKKYAQRHSEKPDMMTRQEYLQQAQERRKHALELRERGRTLADIAAELNVSVDAVKTYLYR